MAFRKRNIALSRVPADSGASSPAPLSVEAAPIPTPPGVRPSPIDGRPTTSTGTPSLDGVLAGHAGLPLGTSILIEESGTTDYAGALLRFYAAEGVVQGHKVHVVGMGEVWGRELPGISEGKSDEKRRESKERAEKMKIAWRYEGLGQFESARGASGVPSSMQCYALKGLTLRDRSTENADTRRESGRGRILPHVRFGEAAHVACGYGDELHRCATNSPIHVIARSNTTECTAAACIDAHAHNTPPYHTVSAVTSVIPSHFFAPQFDTAISTRSSCIAATKPNTTHSHCYAAVVPIPSRLRPRALDGNPVRRCPRALALPVLACADARAISWHNKR